jgi:hypothetical protein
VAYPGAPGSGHRLPNVLPEAESVARCFAQAEELHEDRATPDAVVAHSAQRDVIHMGCHGSFDPTLPDQSGLLLAGGWLTVQRIITDLKLQQTHLFTMGACVSGRVDLNAGDELVGLSQAALTAGARVVVASQWPVHDAATRALFEAFYGGVQAGQSPAHAMQAAAEAVRQRPGWAHPYYWSAFLVNGLAHQTDAAAPPTHAAISERRLEEIEQQRTPKQTAEKRGGYPMHTDAETIVTRTLRQLDKIMEYPQLLDHALDEATRQRVIAELNRLAAEAAQVQEDEAALLVIVGHIGTLLEDSGIMTALLDRPLSEAEQDARRAMTSAALQAAREKARQGAWVREKAEKISNTVPNVVAVLERALPQPQPRKD